MKFESIDLLDIDGDGKAGGVKDETVKLTLFNGSTKIAEQTILGIGDHKFMPEQFKSLKGKEFTKAEVKLSGSGAISAFAFTRPDPIVVIIPEPSTVALIGALGLGALVAVRRRR